MIDNTKIEQLENALRGLIIRPADPDYNEGRSVRNAMIDKLSILIARFSGTINVVNFAPEHELPTANKGKGTMLKVSGLLRRFGNALVLMIMAHVMLVQPSLGQSAETGLSQEENFTLMDRWAEGPCKTVSMIEDTAVIGNGGYLEMVDMKDGETPELLGRLMIPSVVEDVAVNGNHAYVVTRAGKLHVVDISDPTQLQKLGKTEGKFGNTTKPECAVDSGYVYVAAGEAGLHVFDVRTPSQPKAVTKWNETITDVMVLSEYAFVTTADPGFQILDITDPGEPDVVGKEDLGSSGHGLTILWGPGEFLDTYAYIAAANGLHVYNVNDPANPKIVAVAPLDRGLTDVALSDGKIYTISRGQMGGPFPSVRIFDFENPNGLVKVGEYNTGEWDLAWEIAGGAEVAYVALGSGLRLIDSEGTAGRSYHTGGRAWRIYMGENAAYVAADYGGLRLLDISQAATPVEQTSGRFAPGTMWDVVHQDGLIYAADGYANQGALRIFDYTNPDQPEELGIHSTKDVGWAVDLENRYAYLGLRHNGLHVIDVSSPSSPELVGTYSVTGKLEDIAVDGNYVYIGDSEGTFYSVDISVPEEPELLSTYDLGPVIPKALAVQEDYLYIAATFGKMRVLDVSDPGNPMEAGSSTEKVDGRGIALDGQFAYLASGGDGLQLLDISDPASPNTIGGYDTGGFARDVAVKGSFAYVADDEAGVATLRNELAVGITENSTSQPEEFTLRPNYPNPFNTTTSIRYGLPQEAQVTVEIFDLQGRKVTTIIKEQQQSAGSHKIRWNGSDQPSGVYILRVTVGSHQDNRKILLFR